MDAYRFDGHKSECVCFPISIVREIYTHSIRKLINGNRTHDDDEWMGEWVQGRGIWGCTDIAILTHSEPHIAPPPSPPSAMKFYSISTPTIHNHYLTLGRRRRGQQKGRSPGLIRFLVVYGGVVWTIFAPTNWWSNYCRPSTTERGTRVMGGPIS